MLAHPHGIDVRPDLDLAVTGDYATRSASRRRRRSTAEPFGLADVAAGRKIRIGDRFAIRSITKSFTVTLILDLVARGKITLDDPISR